LSQINPSAAAKASQTSLAQINHATATPAPTPIPPEPQIWLAKAVPQPLRDAIQLPSGWKLTDQKNQATLSLDVLPADQKDPGAVVWIYALTAPFPTVTDDYTLTDLKQAWKNGPAADAPFQSLLVDPATQAVFSTLWGPAGKQVRTLASDQLLDTAWKEKTTWAIVPFEALEPRWKVILLDGQSPVEKAFNPEKYGLQASFALKGDPDDIAAFTGGKPLAKSNRQADHMTTVMVTGVTALVRGTASFMEGRGLDYPAQYIGDWLREADILHVSNEVAFAKNCPPPFNWMDLVFCSREKYIKLLEDVGVDVVELTGDHLSDWGPEAVLNTLDMYKERGWKYYGGGANLEDAQKPALMEHNGNKIAFLGCNAKPPGYAKASATTPGALHCDMDEMVAQVKKVRADGYAPIVTFQHLEYYSYTANPILQKDFREMADAGAVIVSGSQAHQPHAFEFDNGAYLHYGLGNLFFDQTNQGFPPRTAFIDRHVFYEGKHISTELLTIYLIDYARSRPMTPEERKTMLETVFQASGW
jgi:poly-gamma-glutamate synthesis protein (capsule biosynthesis protein)